MSVIVHVNPITYAVHAVRSTVFAHIDAPGEAIDRLNPPLHWGSYEVPTLMSLGLVVVIGLALSTLAIAQFNRSE